MKKDFTVLVTKEITIPYSMEASSYKEAKNLIIDELNYVPERFDDGTVKYKFKKL